MPRPCHASQRSGSTSTYSPCLRSSSCCSSPACVRDRACAPQISQRKTTATGMRRHSSRLRHSRAAAAASGPRASSSGGEPRSSQVPSARRTSGRSRRSVLERGGHGRALASRPADRAARGTGAAAALMPSGVTWPHRSARCQNSTSSRVSTGDSCSSASWIDIRCVRRSRARAARSSPAASRRASGRARSSRTASRTGDEHVPAHPVAQQALVARGLHGWSTSPSPSSSVQVEPASDHVAREQPSSIRKPSRLALGVLVRDLPVARRRGLRPSPRARARASLDLRRRAPAAPVRDPLEYPARSPSSGWCSPYRPVSSLAQRP